MLKSLLTGKTDEPETLDTALSELRGLLKDGPPDLADRPAVYGVRMFAWSQERTGPLTGQRLLLISDHHALVNYMTPSSAHYQSVVDAFSVPALLITTKDVLNEVVARVAPRDCDREILSRINTVVSAGDPIVVMSEGRLHQLVTETQSLSRSIAAAVDDLEAQSIAIVSRRGTLSCTAAPKPTSSARKTFKHVV